MEKLLLEYAAKFKEVDKTYDMEWCDTFDELLRDLHHDITIICQEHNITISNDE